MKTYHLVKEYGEDVNRMCRELEVNGSTVPVFHTDDFILKPNRLIEKLIEKASINRDKLTENKIAILTIMIEDPYIYKSDLSKFVGISKLLLVITLKQCVVNASAVSVLTKADFGKLSNKKDYNFLGTKQHFLGYLGYFLGTILSTCVNRYNLK